MKTQNCNLLRRLSAASRRACWYIIGGSTICALLFDWFIHLTEIANHPSGAPGDFLTFRDNALLAMHAPSAAAGAGAMLPYPPPFLLLTAPVSWLPPLPAYILWLAVSLICFGLAARHLGLPWRVVGLGGLAQPALYGAVIGQSGLLVSGFLLAAFGLAQTQPIIAGIAAGLVIIKPQFGLLLPVCYLAARNKRAFVTAALSVAGLLLLTAAGFGLNIWTNMQKHQVSGAHSLLVAHWPSNFQFIMTTPYITLQSLGVSQYIAGWLQGAVSLAAALAAWRLWRQPMPKLERLAPTLALVMLATPYAYIYDLPCLAVALAGLWWAKRDGLSLAALALLFAFTCLYAPLSVFSGISWGGIALAAILLLVWPRAARPSRVTMPA